jgi:F-type H+-transporting ATPase subunit delta
MAELATIARPYAEALFKAAGGDSAGLVDQLGALAAVAADDGLRQFADNPKVSAAQVNDLVLSVLGGTPDARIANLLRTVIDNGRLAALPEVAAQFKVLVNAQSGMSDAIVYSAYPIGPDALAGVVEMLQRRFGRKLSAKVEIDAELIGGIRVVVGDEVLDTSVKARLEQMKVALTA